MIKNLVGGFIMVLFVIGGAIAADALKPGDKRFFDSATSTGSESAGPAMAGAATVTAHEEKPVAQVVDEKAEPPKEKKAAKKNDHGSDDKSGHDDGHGEKGKSGPTAYYKFSREFIVPVISDNNVQSLVIIDLNLEIDPNLGEDLYAMDPKLRDVLMTELIALSNEGRFATRMTDPANYAEIRARLLTAIHAIQEKGVRDVLILDLARQDQ